MKCTYPKEKIKDARSFFNKLIGGIPAPTLARMTNDENGDIVIIWRDIDMDRTHYINNGRK